MGLQHPRTTRRWGNDQRGQLGDGTTAERAVPAQTGGGPWVKFACGEVQAVAIKEDGTLWTLGARDPWDNPNPTQVQVETDTDWMTVTSGLRCTIALKRDGSRWGMGSDEVGQLGGGPESKTWIQPLIRLDEANDWVDVQLGQIHALGLKADGNLWAWGSDGFGEIGDGFSPVAGSPVQATGLALDHDPPFVWAVPPGGLFQESVIVSLLAEDEILCDAEKETPLTLAAADGGFDTRHTLDYFTDLPRFT